MREIFDHDLKVVSNSAVDIVAGWDFKDEELLSVIGKKDT